MQGGGPSGSLAPHNFAIYFKEGGVGTFLPLYFNFLEYVRYTQQRMHSSGAPTAPQPPPDTREMLSKAWVPQANHYLGLLLHFCDNN